MIFLFEIDRTPCDIFVEKKAYQRWDGTTKRTNILYSLTVKSTAKKINRIKLLDRLVDLLTEWFLSYWETDLTWLFVFDVNSQRFIEWINNCSKQMQCNDWFWTNWFVQDLNQRTHIDRWRSSYHHPVYSMQRHRNLRGWFHSGSF